MAYIIRRRDGGTVDGGVYTQLKTTFGKAHVDKHETGTHDVLLAVCVETANLDLLKNFMPDTYEAELYTPPKPAYVSSQDRPSRHFDFAGKKLTGKDRDKMEVSVSEAYARSRLGAHNAELWREWIAGWAPYMLPTLIILGTAGTILLGVRYVDAVKGIMPTDRRQQTLQSIADELGYEPDGYVDPVDLVDLDAVGGAVEENLEFVPVP